MFLLMHEWQSKYDWEGTDFTEVVGVRKADFLGLHLGHTFSQFFVIFLKFNREGEARIKKKKKTEPVFLGLTEGRTEM